MNRIRMHWSNAKPLKFCFSTQKIATTTIFILYYQINHSGEKKGNFEIYKYLISTIIFK